MTPAYLVSVPFPRSSLLVLARLHALALSPLVVCVSFTYIALGPLVVIYCLGSIGGHTLPWVHWWSYIVLVHWWSYIALGPLVVCVSILNRFQGLYH